jgi:hypothetical protein
MFLLLPHYNFSEWHFELPKNKREKEEREEEREREREVLKYNLGTQVRTRRNTPMFSGCTMCSEIPHGE